MKIGIIVQARTSSTRLPKKVLKELPYSSGVTVLQQVIRRLKKANRINEIIIATTHDKEDEDIINLAKKEKVNWFVGSKEDVLERYYLAAKENKLTDIVRVTSDCPCIDSELVDQVVEEHLKTGSDYTSNSLVRTFPHGQDAEIVNFPSLEKAYSGARNDFEREHVTPYIYKTKPNLFKIHIVKAKNDLYAPDIRITLDTSEDYVLLCSIYDYLYNNDNFFGIGKIIDLFNNKPWLKLITQKISQKKIFNTHKEEIKEAIKLLDLQDLKNSKKILESYLMR